MRTSRSVEGFGLYQFDTDLYEAAMTQTVAQLRERVHQGCEGMESGTRTKVNKLRKADLAAMVAEWDTGARENERQAGPDAPMSEQDRFARMNAEFGKLPSGEFYDPTLRNELTESAPGFLSDASTDPREGAALDAFEQDFALGDVPELEYIREVEATNDADADAELLSFMRTVVAAPSLPALPITETDVSAAEVYLVVQLGDKLFDGKLISVINRRTRYLPAFLVTVELADGVRRLVRADHTLAA